MSETTHALLTWVLVVRSDGLGYRDKGRCDAADVLMSASENRAMRSWVLWPRWPGVDAADADADADDVDDDDDDADADLM
eukprot:888635-Rhodomonas_salina.1